MYHPVLTEAFNGQKIGYTTETLVATMLKAWLTSGRTGTDRV